MFENFFVIISVVFWFGKVSNFLTLGLEISRVLFILFRQVLDRIQRLGLDLEGVVDLNLAQKQGTDNMRVHGFGLLEELSQLGLTGLDSDSPRLHNFLNKFFLTLSTQSQ